jgi:hypothetical protein
MCRELASAAIAAALKRLQPLAAGYTEECVGQHQIVRL